MFHERGRCERGEQNNDNPITVGARLDHDWNAEKFGFEPTRHVGREESSQHASG